jgi:hypothetical protein
MKRILATLALLVLTVPALAADPAKPAEPIKLGAFFDLSGRSTPKGGSTAGLSN